MLKELKIEETALLLLLQSENDFSDYIADSDFKDKNWEAFYQLSTRHSIAPLVYFILKSNASYRHVPKNIVTKLHKAFLGNSVQNTYIYYYLSTIIKNLNKNDIPFILLKGAHLSKLVYPDTGACFMTDVDILFKRNDLNRAQTVIKASAFKDNTPNLSIDYHWYIEQFLDLNMNGIWQRAWITEIDGLQVRVLSPEDLIIHLCIHFSFHHDFQSASLRSLYDIRITLDRYADTINWDEVILRSREWKVRNSVYISLLLAKKLIAANVPNEILEILCMPSYTPAKFEWAVQQIFNANPPGQGLSPYFWQLFTPGFSRRKLTSLVKILFPSPEFISQKYDTINGTFHNYLHYFVRVNHKLLRYIKAIVLILIQNTRMREMLHHQIKHIEMKDWLSSE